MRAWWRRRWRRCGARLEPGKAGPYWGRCDLQAGHPGAHELERGMDTVFFDTRVLW